MSVKICLLIVFVFVAFTNIVAQEEEIDIQENIEVIEMVEQNPDEGFLFVEEPATFQGGDLLTFKEWVNNNIQYPQEDITGRVILQFSVDTSGFVCQVKVVRSIHPIADEEVVRVVKSSPKWTPAKQSGKKVKQNFTIPITFKPE